jgi:hypothetical protein
MVLKVMVYNANGHVVDVIEVCTDSIDDVRQVLEESFDLDHDDDDFCDDFCDDDEYCEEDYYRDDDLDYDEED